MYDANIKQKKVSWIVKVGACGWEGLTWKISTEDMSFISLTPVNVSMGERGGDIISVTDTTRVPQISEWWWRVAPVPASLASAVRSDPIHLSSYIPIFSSSRWGHINLYISIYIVGRGKWKQRAPLRVLYLHAATWLCGGHVGELGCYVVKSCYILHGVSTNFNSCDEKWEPIHYSWILISLPKHLCHVFGVRWNYYTEAREGNLYFST